MSPLETNKQEFGVIPTATRDTNHYTAEYVQSFVAKWDQLIDWNARSKSEGNFLLRN